MLSLYQLKNKLNKQAKDFSLLLELPDLLGQGLWAKGIFGCSHFSQAHERLSELFEAEDDYSILKHDSFKYLMIGEVDDRDIIESLHIKITSMADSIEQLMLVDIETLELVSAIYRVLGLSDEADFIVNTGASFRLEWQPYLGVNAELLDVKFADLNVHGCSYRLIATKLPFKKLSLDNIKKYLSSIHSQREDLFSGDTSEQISFLKHVGWLVNSYEQFKQCEQNPTSFKIDGVRHLVSGFLLKSSLIDEQVKPELALQVKNLDGNQKFIVRIDQQTLVYFARRVDESTFNTVHRKNFIAEYRKGVLSHFDADNELLNVDGIEYLTCFRPFYCTDLKGAK